MDTAPRCCVIQQIMEFFTAVSIWIRPVVVIKSEQGIARYSCIVDVLNRQCTYHGHRGVDHNQQGVQD